MKPKTQRAWILATSFLCIAAAITLVLKAFEDNIVFFYTPSDTLTKTLLPQQRIRIGGIVEPNSIKSFNQGEYIEFRLIDNSYSITVTYAGIVPDLFREGKVAVAEGYLLDKGNFKAINILAKHDENYMPPGMSKKVTLKKGS